jgi:hypothetical protein
MSLESLHRGIAADIASHGWSVMQISDNYGGPDFAYSIGLLPTFEHPEIFIIGLPLDLAYRLLNDVGHAVREGRSFADGDTADDFLEGYAVTFRQIPKRQLGPYLGTAIRFLEVNSFPALQFVYPDREHHWPWQEGVSEGFRTQQPVLADAPVPPWASDPAV